jgi:hypothetical protein
MNERILELAEQAGIKINPRRLYWDDEPDGYLESDNDFILNNQEIVIKVLEGDALKKLAELIVWECINEIHVADIGDLKGKGYYLDKVAEHIEKHFGV